MPSIQIFGFASHTMPWPWQCQVLTCCCVVTVTDGRCLFAADSTFKAPRRALQSVRPHEQDVRTAAASAAVFAFVFGFVDDNVGGTRGAA